MVAYGDVARGLVITSVGRVEGERLILGNIGSFRLRVSGVMRMGNSRRDIRMSRQFAVWI